MADSKEVKEVLAAIANTKGLREKIRGELGLAKDLDEIVADDMYQFEYFKPDIAEGKNRSVIILHGKCIDAGQKLALSWGYQFVRTDHIPAKDEKRFGTMCVQCKTRLDEKKYAKFIKERDARLKREHEEWLEEQAYRKEWEAEQILLGKM